MLWDAGPCKSINENSYICVQIKPSRDQLGSDVLTRVYVLMVEPTRMEAPSWSRCPFKSQKLKLNFFTMNILQWISSHMKILLIQSGRNQPQFYVVIIYLPHWNGTPWLRPQSATGLAPKCTFELADAHLVLQKSCSVPHVSQSPMLS